MEEIERMFALPVQHVPYHNIVSAAVHNARICGTFYPDRYPRAVEMLYKILRPKLKEKVKRFREGEEKEIEEKVWKETGNRELALTARYDALFEKIVEVLDSAGMFVLHVRKIYGGEPDAGKAEAPW